MSDTVSQVSKIRGLRELSNLEAASKNLLDTIGLSEGLELELESGDTFIVDKTDAKASMWKEFLDWQQKSQLPVYVEVETQSRIVREVFPAFRRRADHVNREPVIGRLRIVFRESPAIFFLNPALPRFREMWTRIERAAGSTEEMLVTHHPLTFEIIDVREAPPPAPPLPPNPLAVNVAPAPAETAVTLQRANEIFEAMAATDIPFFHVRDCCTARAQKMCRLMLENFNVTARKIWNYGSGFAIDKGTICVETLFDPSGQVCWRFHVAPIVNVVDGPPDTVVIDPSIFDEPVPIETWLQVQRDSGGTTQESTDANNFENKPNSPDDLFDPGPAAIDEKLKNHTGQSIVARNLNALVFAPPN